MSELEDIEIPNIEKELTRLLAEATHEQMHASLFNLILFSTEMKHLQGLLDSIVRKFPSRIIVVEEDRQKKEDYLRINVSSEVSGKIACDRISIEATTNNLKRVPFIILPHLLPDLPVYLLWGQDPTSDHLIVPYLKPFASRLIFDSNTTENLSDFSSRILEMKKSLPHVELADINWILMTGWRRVCRQVFASSAFRKHLQKPTDIQIGYNDISAPWPVRKELQAIYLLFWLASAMKWKVISQKKDDGIFVYKCQANGADFNVTLFPQKYKDISAGMITNLEIVSGEQTYVIAPYPGLARVVIHISSQEACELPYTLPLPCLKPGFPYIQEMLFLPISSHYLQMLESLRECS